MAPKRKGGARKASAAAEKPPPEDVEKQEVSVSATAEEAVAEEEEDEKKAEEEPSPKKTKVEEKKKPGRKPKAASKKQTGSATKKSADEDDVKEEVGPADVEAVKVIVIEASKECNCFKTRAAKVQTGLTKAIPGVEVLINPDKPRKGCFEVRAKDGDVYLSLQGLPRPFTKLKNMDMDKVVEDIVAKVK